MKVLRSPIQAKPVKPEAIDAWWYENRGSISVVIQGKPGMPTMQCRINRKRLADWIKRTEPSK